MPKPTNEEILAVLNYYADKAAFDFHADSLTGDRRTELHIYAAAGILKDIGYKGASLGVRALNNCAGPVNDAMGQIYATVKATKWGDVNPYAAMLMGKK